LWEYEDVQILLEALNNIDNWEWEFYFKLQQKNTFILGYQKEKQWLMNNTLLLWLLNILKETLVNNTLLLANEYSQRNFGEQHTFTS
jgi:hypothetical protein